MKCLWFLSILLYLNNISALGVYSDDSFLRTLKGFLDTRDVSEGCQEAVKLLIENIQSTDKTDTWGLQMLDATSKIPVGLLALNLGEVGQFSECMSTQSANGLIQPRYCLGTLSLNFSSANSDVLEQHRKAHQIRKMSRAITNFDDDGDDQNADNAGLQIGVSWAICAPIQCSAEDIEEGLTGLLTPGSLTCQTKEDVNLPLTYGAIATISFLSLITYLLVQSTVMDFYYRHVKRVPPHPLLIAFSVYSNGEKLFRVSKNSNELTCLNGIRFWSMMWVVIGHVYANFVAYPLFNFLDIVTWLDSLRSMTIVSATLSVDSFFFMSGLLLVYGYMKAKKQGIKFNIFLFYFHRYLRLTPALAAGVLVSANLLKYTGSGPKWPSISAFEHMCQRYWWSTLLYVQNYVNQDGEICLPQTWYLSVDMQLYVLTPLVLLPLKWPKIGLGIIIATIVGFIISPFCIAYITEIPALISNMNGRVSTNDYMKYYYIKTHARGATWFMGVLAGYLLAKLKFQGSLRNIKVNKILVVLMWAISIAVGLTCVYAGQDGLSIRDYNILESSFYIALVRPAWALCLAWVIFACVAGYGGPINWLLSFPIYQVLNRFTYSIYLIHYPLLSLFAYSAKTPAYFDDMNVAYSFWGITMFSFIISVVWVLAFESPITVVEKVIFSSAKKVSKPVENENKTGVPA